MVVCKQIVDKMLEEYDAKSGSGNILHQDATGTPNHHQHWKSMQVTG